MSLISLKQHIDRAAIKPALPASAAPAEFPGDFSGEFKAIPAPESRVLQPRGPVSDKASDKASDKTSDKTAAAALEGYSEALTAMGAAGELAVPPVSRDFHQHLAGLAEKLRQGASAETIESVRTGVASEISQWSERASLYFKEKADVMREIVMVVARTAEAVGDRDTRYAGELGDLTGRLRQIAGLENFASVRKNLIESAAQLTACVSKMTAEGHHAMEQMRSQVEVYRGRLEDAERRASLDPLTALSNRRATEEALAERIRQGRPFSVILLDLNDFKTVNDSFGHLAGDDLLKQFATELRAQFAPSDTVGRWGGDEFIGILEGHADQALKYHDRIKRWSFGDYSISVGSITHKIYVGGAVGIAEWNGSEPARDLIDRADRDLYAGKEQEPAGRGCRLTQRYVPSAPVA